MKFYAYEPTKDGREPLGGDRRILFEMKTTRGAWRRAHRVFGERCRLFTYTGIYDQSSYFEITRPERVR